MNSTQTYLPAQTLSSGILLQDVAVGLVVLIRRDIISDEDGISLHHLLTITVPLEGEVVGGHTEPGGEIIESGEEVLIAGVPSWLPSAIKACPSKDPEVPANGMVPENVEIFWK